MSSLREIVDKVLVRIRPSPEDKVKLIGIYEALARMIEGCLRNFISDFMVTLQGSVAKDTFIRGETDIDIFVLFNPNEVDVEWFERHFVDAVTRCVASQGLKYVVKYASHPYVTVLKDGVEVNVVPAFRVRSPTEIISAVDRTPYHTAYVNSKLSDAERDEVRVLKYFLKNWGIYGAEIGVKGFSGYLCELMVIAYKSFEEVLRASQSWRMFKTCIDIEGAYGTKDECLNMFKGDALIVVDPVDPRRNAAAAVSSKNVALFKLLARLLLESPSIKFFTKLDSPAQMPEDFERILAERIATTRSYIVALEFDVVDRRPDVVEGQLSRVVRTLRNALRSYGIQDHYVSYWVDESLKEALVLVEILNYNDYELHRGPRADDVDNAVRFLARNINALAGPWLDDDGRLYCVRRRANLLDVIRKVIDGVSLSSIILRRISSDVSTLINKNVSFRIWLHNFIRRKPFDDVKELLAQKHLNVL